MATSSKTLLSVDQFAEMPPDERVRFELVEGELVPLATGTPKHNRQRDLLGRLFAEFERAGLGVALTETDCRTTGNTVRRPDVLFYSNPRWQLVDEEKIPLPFPPDIAVEVLSPSESAIDSQIKSLEYLEAGTQEVWTLNLRTREIHVRDRAGIRVFAATAVVESRALEEFAIPAATIFGLK